MYTLVNILQILGINLLLLEIHTIKNYNFDVVKNRLVEFNNLPEQTVSSMAQ